MRDVCASPHDVYMFAAGFDNGTVQLWDVRYIEDCVSRTQAHDGACVRACVRVCVCVYVTFDILGVDEGVEHEIYLIYEKDKSIISHSLSLTHSLVHTHRIDARSCVALKASAAGLLRQRPIRQNVENPK